MPPPEDSTPAIPGDGESEPHPEDRSPLPAEHYAAKEKLIDMVESFDRTIATLQANRAAVLALLLTMAEHEADAAQSDPALDTSSWHSDVARTFVRSTALEVGATTRTHDRAIEHQMQSASTVLRTLPCAAAAWREGRISSAHVRVIEEFASSLDDDRRSDFDRRLTEVAIESTVARTRRRALQITAALDPEGVDNAHRAHAERRRVDLQHLSAGMSLLSAYLPSVTARAAYDRLTRLARSGATASNRGSAGAAPGRGTAGEDPASRSFDARRADALTDLLLAGSVTESLPNAAINAIRPQVSVTIPALTMLGTGIAPAWLDGCSPIPFDTAMRLLSNSHDVLRIVTDPLTGMPVAADVYRTPRRLRRLIETGKHGCTAPGCTIAAAECDLDHTHEFSRGGATALDNLAPLCRRHHVLRHTLWSLKNDGGSYVWTSPAGRRFTLAGEPLAEPIATNTGDDAPPTTPPDARPRYLTNAPPSALPDAPPKTPPNAPPGALLDAPPTTPPNAPPSALPDAPPTTRPDARPGTLPDAPRMGRSDAPTRIESVPRAGDGQPGCTGPSESGRPHFSDTPPRVTVPAGPAAPPDSGAGPEFTAPSDPGSDTEFAAQLESRSPIGPESPPKFRGWATAPPDDGGADPPPF